MDESEENDRIKTDDASEQNDESADQRDDAPFDGADDGETEEPPPPDASEAVDAAGSATSVGADAAGSASVLPEAPDAAGESAGSGGVLPEAPDAAGESAGALQQVPGTSEHAEIVPVTDSALSGGEAAPRAGPSLEAAPRAGPSLEGAAPRAGPSLEGAPRAGPSLEGAAREAAQRALEESLQELRADSTLHTYAAKPQLVRVPTALVKATESEARALMGLPPPEPEPAVLETIWREPTQYHDVRSWLSRIWAQDETALHGILSEIWQRPAMRAILSEIWEEAVQLVKPRSVLSQIWAEPPELVDIRSVLSQIWSDDTRERLRSILSEIWATPAVRSVLSEIWGSDRVKSVLSEIWDTPVEKVDIRSVLSQIWAADHDAPPPRSVLSEIWAQPAVRSVLSQIWGAPKLRSVLSEIWELPVERVDIRSVLSQIWSSEHDDARVRSVLSEIWATPAVHSVLSDIWRKAEVSSATLRRVEYHATESEMLLEELMESLQRPEPELAEGYELTAQESETEEPGVPRRERRRHRYVTATEDDVLPASRPLTVRWVFGGSSRTPILNLTNEEHRAIVYGAAQCAVIYDYERNTQKLLQGHRNCVCGLAVSPDGRWIASADIGPDNAIVVWDTLASAPLQMHFPSEPFSGPLALAFSCDSRYVVGLWGRVSATEAGEPRARQQLLVWDWTLENARPRVLHQFGASHGFHHHLSVSQLDPTMMATTCSSRLMFFQMNEEGRTHHCPELRSHYSQDFKCNPGHFAQTAFSNDDPYMAVTGTDKGYLIMWSDRRPSAPCDTTVLTPTVKKEARKVLKISDTPITCIQIMDGMICVGTSAGEVGFLDQALRLRRWYRRFPLAAVRGLSFALSPPRDAAGELGAGDGSALFRAEDGAPEEQEEEAGPPFPPDCSLEAAPLAARDLLVTDADGFCGLIRIRSGQCQRIAQFPVVTVRALDVNKNRPYVVIGAYDGSLRVYDYEKKKLVVETTISGNNRVHSVAFSPSGLHLAAGMQTGDLVILDGLTLRPEGERITLSRAAITQCLFSPDSDLLATRDDDLVVSVYRYQLGQQWSVLGRYRAHYRPIVDLLFAPGQTEDAPPRLLSLGEDRVLVEYDLINSTKENPVVLCCDTLEQSAVPLCMALYPPLTSENFILVANSQYKLKQFNAHTRMCRSVVLGSQYGAPIDRIKVVPRLLSCDTGLAEEQHAYLAFATCGNIGLQVLPADGNPRKAASVIGHPGKVEQLECSADGRWLFTAGGDDGCVFMWEIYPEALEAMSMLGGSGMTPFYDQLAGGRDGELYRRLEDLVYYTQLLCQGEDLMERREVSQRVPLHTVPDVLRAIGFFPTEKEIEDMENEVRYREYAVTGRLVEEVHLDDIIRLYVSHRPIVDVGAEQISWALQAAARGSARGPQRGGVAKKDWLRTLQAKGEHMSEKELAAVLAELLDPDAQSLPLGAPLNTVEPLLPKVVTLNGLCSELLGMPELLATGPEMPVWESPSESDRSDTAY